MAERLNKLDTERVLERIKLSQLVNLLQNNALGTLKVTNGEKKGEPYELSKSRYQSAMWLLERRLARAVAPQDLNLSGDLSVRIVRFSDMDKTIEPEAVPSRLEQEEHRPTS